MSEKWRKIDPIYCIFGSRRNLFALWGALVLLAKAIRYTVLRASLVDASSGQDMVHTIKAGLATFTWFNSSESANAGGNAAWLFQKLNVLMLSSYTEFEVAITVVWNFLLIYLLFRCASGYSDLQAVFLIVSIMALNIWDFNLAKEPVQLLFFVGMFFVLNTEKLTPGLMWAGCILCILLSVLTFRKYYVLMIFWSIFAAVFYRVVLSKEINAKKILLFAFGIALSYLMLLLVLQVLSPDDYRELLRVRSRTSTATTDICAIVSTDNLVILSANYLVTLLRLLFPVELLRFGVKYAIYAAAQVALSAVYLKAMWSFQRLESHERIAFFLFSGFLMMSAAFEPDFGSWIRHEMAAFPLLLVVSGVTKRGSGGDSKIQPSFPEKAALAGVFDGRLD